MAFRVSLPIWFAGFVFLAASTPSLQAQSDQLQPKTSFHEAPFAVLVNRIGQKDAINYAQSLSEQLEIGNGALTAFGQSGAAEPKSEVERPVSGTLFFLAKGMLPSVATVQFNEVKDEAEYEKLVRLQKTQMGDNSEVQGKDGKHKIISTWSTVSEETGTAIRLGDDDSEDSDQPQNRIAISIGSEKGASVEIDQIDETDQSEVSSGSLVQYLRYHGNLMYLGNSEDVWHMALPTRDAMLKDASQNVDMGAEVYLSRIPIGLKTLGWNMFYGGLSTQLQQRDEERDIDYEFRSSGGELAFAIAKAGMFDADHINGYVALAREDQPIRAELSVSARQNSDLANRLADVSSARSRFAPILNDDAAITLHMAVKLPEESIRVMKTGAEWLKDQLIQQAGTDVDLVISGAEIAETLGEIADHSSLEMFLKLGWTPSSGGVIYGGMQVDENPELLRSVLTLLTPESVPADFVDRFVIKKIGDLEVIEFLLPRGESDADLPIHLSHVYITHANSCLWFCVGGENSHEILRLSVDRCVESGLRANTRVLTGEIDLEKWMSYPQDDATGLTSLLQLADRGIASEIRNTDENGTSAQSDDLLQRVIALGGRQDIQIYVDSSKTGLKLHADVGQAIGNYFSARWLQAIDSTMNSLELPDPDKTDDIQASEAKPE